jgi:hypothetical protein
LKYESGDAKSDFQMGLWHFCKSGIIQLPICECGSKLNTRLGSCDMPMHKGFATAREIYFTKWSISKRDTTYESDTIYEELENAIQER